MILGVASTISGGVSVVFLKLKALFFEVDEGVLHETTVATLVGFSVTVNELLLGEGEKLVVFEEVLTLNVGDGGESPARTTLTLVLDGGDGAGRHPVDLGRAVEAVGLVERARLRGDVVAHAEVVQLDKLVEAQVRELVVRHGVGLVALGVVLVDELVVGRVDLEARGELVARREIEAELLAVCVERGLELARDRHGSGEEGEGEDDGLHVVVLCVW